MPRTDGVVPFQLGETLAGTDDDGNLINEDKLGLVVEFPAIRSASNQSDKGKRTAYPVKAIALRNISGGTLAPKTTAVLDVTSYTGTGTKDGFLNASSGNTDAIGEIGVVVDEFLPGTVADDDIFWGVFEGPVTALTDADYTGTSTVLQKVVCGANGGADNQGTATGEQQLLGYVMQAGVTGTGSDILIFARNGVLRG